MFDNNPFREYKKMIKELNIPDEVQREREQEFIQAAITPKQREDEARRREEAAKKREQEALERYIQADKGHEP